MDFKNDPIGYAIQDFVHGKNLSDITVKSDLCEDDTIPVKYLFREYEEMPQLEQFALSKCHGRVLDVGAGTGCHSAYLHKKGCEVVALEKSHGAAANLAQQDFVSANADFMSFNEGKFDSILLLMNGVGLAGSLKNLPIVLKHLKSLLAPGGKIFCDSTDIIYMYTNEDGSVWMDLNSSYYGEMQFNMIYRDIESGWFPWLYVDQLKLTEIATEAGFEIDIIFEGEDNHYLAELKID